MLDAKKQTGKHRHPYLANFNVQWFYFDFSTLNQMDFDEADQIEFSLENGDLMVCEGGEVGRCAIWRGEIKHCYFQKAVHRVRCNIRQVLPEYLAWWFKFHSDYNGFADIVGSKATIAHLPGVKLKKLEIPVPNIEDQERFVRFIEQLDKSKYVAYQLTLFLNKLIKYKLQSLFQEECICSLKM
jgi:type I restriction enzyme S subunit